MTRSVVAVAAEIRRRLTGAGEVKVHKLLYYAQGHHLATFGEPLFSETISAWDMGPVVGRLWRLEHDADPLLEGTSTAETLDESELNTIGYVLGRYGGLTGNDLIRLSHSETPWIEADSRRHGGESEKISSSSLRQYFATVASEDEASQPPLEAASVHELVAGAEARLSLPASVDSLDALTQRRAQLR